MALDVSGTNGVSEPSVVTTTSGLWISLWCNPDAVAYGGGLVQIGPILNIQIAPSFSGTPGVIQVWVIGDLPTSTGLVFLNSGADFATSAVGSWHHILVYIPASGSSISIWWDGVAGSVSAYDTATWSDITFSSALVQIGYSDENGGGQDGQIAEVGIWDASAAPSSAEIDDLSDATGATRPGDLTTSATLLFYAPLDTASGYTLDTPTGTLTDVGSPATSIVSSHPTMAAAGGPPTTLEGRAAGGAEFGGAATAASTVQTRGRAAGGATLGGEARASSVVTSSLAGRAVGGAELGGAARARAQNEARGRAAGGAELGGRAQAASTVQAAARALGGALLGGAARAAVSVTGAITGVARGGAVLGGAARAQTEVQTRGRALGGAVLGGQARGSALESGAVSARALGGAVLGGAARARSDLLLRGRALGGAVLGGAARGLVGGTIDLRGRAVGGAILGGRARGLVAAPVALDPRAAVWETDEDRAAYLDLMGTAVVLDGVAALGILDWPHMQALEVASVDAYLWVRSSDAASVVRGAEVQAREYFWEVATIEPDGEGITRLGLYQGAELGVALAEEDLEDDDDRLAYLDAWGEDVAVGSTRCRGLVEEPYEAAPWDPSRVGATDVGLWIRTDDAAPRRGDAVTAGGRRWRVEAIERGGGGITRLALRRDV